MGGGKRRRRGGEGGETRESNLGDGIHWSRPGGGDNPPKQRAEPPRHHRRHRYHRRHGRAIRPRVPRTACVAVPRCILSTGWGLLAAAARLAPLGPADMASAGERIMGIEEEVGSAIVGYFSFERGEWRSRAVEDEDEESRLGDGVGIYVSN